MSAPGTIPARAAPDAEAVILAAGRGERLGRGPKAFLALGGRTLLERAVEVMAAVAGRVAVAVPAAEVARARALLGARAAVAAGGDTRAETLRRLLAGVRAPFVVVHDVVHPFVSVELARRVLDAARAGGAATAAIRPGDHVFREADGSLRRVRPAAALWVSQKPQAFARRALAARLAAAAPLDPEDGVLDLLAEAGQPVTVVPGDPRNIKITTAGDWALAQQLESGGRTRRAAGGREKESRGMAKGTRGTGEMAGAIPPAVTEA